MCHSKVRFSTLVRLLANVLVNRSEDKTRSDQVRIYSAEKIQSQLGMRQSDLIFMAILCGGDYDKVYFLSPRLQRIMSDMSPCRLDWLAVGSPSLLNWSIFAWVTCSTTPLFFCNTKCQLPLKPVVGNFELSSQQTHPATCAVDTLNLRLELKKHSPQLTLYIDMSLLSSLT